MKRGLLWLGIIALVAGCKNESGTGKFEVSGTIANSGAKMIYLEELPPVTMLKVVVDSATLGADGKNTLKAKATEATIFNLRLDQQEYPLASVVNDNAKITVNANIKDKTFKPGQDYEVKNSDASQRIHDFMFRFSNDLQKIYTASKRYDSLHASGAGDSILAPLVQEQKNTAAGLKKYTLDAIEKSGNPAVGLFQFGYYQETAGKGTFGLDDISEDEINTIITGLATRHPEHSGVSSLKSLWDMALARSKEMNATMWVGKTAPEISLPDVNGKEIKLSSYRGKYVLVDFWASWCKPCRHENPVVVNAYQKYKAKNFDILGVSLDDKKENWVEAIKEDNLTWTHVSDLQGWSSAVVPVYNFGQVGIPYNVLLDPEGKVIAERLRGADLEAKLAEVLK